MEEHNFYKKLGDKIRALRTEKSLSQADLAERSGLETRQIGRIERGETDPRLGSLIAISKALDTTLIKLLEIE